LDAKKELMGRELNKETILGIGGRVRKSLMQKKKRQKGRTVLDVVVFINISKLLQSPA